MEGRKGSSDAARAGQVSRGAHASGVTRYNKHYHGIELEGDYRQAYAITSQQREALVNLCAHLCRWAATGSEAALDIVPHAEVLEGHTDCPGLLIGHMNEIRQSIRQRITELEQGTPIPTPFLAPVNGPASDSGKPVTGPIAPAPDANRLRSRFFSSDSTLAAVADGHLELTTSSQPREAVGLVQDALNNLGTLDGNFQVDLGSSKQFRGFYGPKTRAAVIAFERAFRLTTDGVIDSETILALDDAMSRLERGINPMPMVMEPAESTPGTYAPPAGSAVLFQNVDFSKASASEGAKYRHAYGVADADPHLAKSDPSNCRALLKFPNAVFFEAKMAICADGSPRALQIDSPFGQTGTAFTFPKTTNAFFNAEEVPYIVLPGKASERDFVGDFGIGKLDVGVVIANGRMTPAFYGEVGPVFRIGEASIKVHENLPVKFPWTTAEKKHVRNASVPGEILYVIFPGSAVTRSQGMSTEDWLAATLQMASDRFAAFVASGGAA